jgi:hypothetical protein
MISSPVPGACGIFQFPRKLSLGPQMTIQNHQRINQTRSARTSPMPLCSSSDHDALGEEYAFKDPPEPKKRKSRLEELGIPKPEKRELTEEERRKAEELAADFSKFSTPIKQEDFWKGLDSGGAF